MAIALMGDWGSGKFAANVRPVSFNAWHYSDDRLWTGLIEHLFHELAAPSAAHYLSLS